MLKKLKNTCVIVVSLLILALLSGCANTPTSKSTSTEFSNKPHLAERNRSPEELWQTRLKFLETLHQWQMDGRIGVVNGKEGGQATFVWKQKGDYYHIRFFGPFGAGALSIEGNAHQVSLQEANGKIHYAKTPEELMARVAGWHVPLSEIRYWILGISDPKKHVHVKRFTPSGLLSQLNQSGWVIEFDHYKTSSSTSMPGKLNMINGDLKVKLMIKAWHFGND